MKPAFLCLNRSDLGRPGYLLSSCEDRDDTGIYGTQHVFSEPSGSKWEDPGQGRGEDVKKLMIFSPIGS